MASRAAGRTARRPIGSGKIGGFFGEIGKMFSIGLETLHVTFRRPWPRSEFVEQVWFLVRVTTLPVILVSIPFGMIISLHVGSFLVELGSQAHIGAAMVLAVVREEAPVVTALLIAGAGGPAVSGHGPAVMKNRSIAAERSWGSP